MPHNEINDESMSAFFAVEEKGSLFLHDKVGCHIWPFWVKWRPKTMLFWVFFISILRCHVPFTEHGDAVPNADILQHYQVPTPLAAAFVEQVGSSGEDMKLLSALPPRVAAAGLQQSRLADGSTL